MIGSYFLAQELKVKRPRRRVRKRANSPTEAAEAPERELVSP